MKFRYDTFHFEGIGIPLLGILMRIIGAQKFSISKFSIVVRL